MLKAQAGERLGKALRRGRKTERRRGNKNRGEGKGERWNAARGDKNDRQELPPGFSFCSKHPKLDCEQRGASAQRHASQSIPTTRFTTVGAFFKTRKTFLRLHVRQTRNQKPRQVNARVCAKPRSKSRRFPLACPSFSSLTNPFRQHDCPCQRNATLSPQQTATPLPSPWHPASATFRLYRIRCTNCETCTTAAAFNAGSEFRLLACRRRGLLMSPTGPVH